MNPPAGSIPGVRKICWRRDRLLTPVFLGFPCGSAVKESTCNAGNCGWSLGWEDPLEKGKATTPVFWPGEFYGLYRLWGWKESDTTGLILLSLPLSLLKNTGLEFVRYLCMVLVDTWEVQNLFIFFKSHLKVNQIKFGTSTKLFLQRFKLKHSETLFKYAKQFQPPFPFLRC